ncbi:MAG: hypothetical protein M3N47_05225, partial [Chloroflexota bacterium]|nr:hypothetical protein [Chloroflexota bacterium]
MIRLVNLAVLGASRALAACRVLPTGGRAGSKSRRAARRPPAHIAPLVVLVLALLLAGAVGGPVDRAVADDPQCSDKIDNDADGKIDFPDDPGCRRPGDKDERNACVDGRDNDDDHKVDFPADPGCTDATDNDETDPPVPTKPQCSDAQDNDHDGKIDALDPGCSSADDNDETDPPPPPPTPTPAPYCSDGIDNDGDQKVDFGADPGCSSTGDNDETDPPAAAAVPAATSSPPPYCSDGRDNDGDQKVDFGADPGCSSPGDNDESDPAVVVVSSSASPRLLSPFPVVRLRGQILTGRVRISLLTVRAPIGSRITITCSVRRACPRRTSKRVTTTRTVRFRAFERRQLRVGTILRIYVTKPGFVGKYTRFKIRRRGAPLRSDR